MAIKAILGAIQKGSGAIGKVASKITGTQAKIAAGVGAVVATGVAVGSAVKSIKDSVNSVGNMLNGAASGNVGSIINGIVPDMAPSYSSGSKASLTYPKTLSNVSLNPAWINFQFYDRDTNTSLTSINLPMPDSVKNPSSISWDQGDFGMIGDTAVKAISAINPNESVSMESVKSKLDAIVGRATSLAAYEGLSSFITKAGGNSISSGDLMGASAGKIPNPYKTMLFRGVDFRSFVFTFQLVPFTEDDCDLIYNIIQKFREHSYPAFSDGNMFFTYPDECKITYMWENGENKWLNSFKRCVCTGVDIDFTPRGQWSSLRNGFPNVVEISTRWSEVEVVVKQDITDRRR